MNFCTKLHDNSSCSFRSEVSDSQTWPRQTGPDNVMKALMKTSGGPGLLWCLVKVYEIHFKAVKDWHTVAMHQFVFE